MDAQIVTNSPAETRAWGRRLGQALQPGDLLCLQGDLGAGKTTLTQGLAAGWGSADAVSSPTFVMVNLYRAADGRPLYHMDAYRLQSLVEAAELDLEEMLSQGALIIEWPERLLPLLPPERLWLHLDYVAEGAESRNIHLFAHGPRYQALLAALV